LCKLNIMKKIFLLFTAFSNFLIAQEVQKVEVVRTDDQISNLFDELGTNEIKLDLVDIIAFPAFDITYEKIKNPYSSFGASLFLNLNPDDGSLNWTNQFSLTPFYRFYFFNKEDYGGKGFFAEVFIKFSSYNYDLEYYNYNPDPTQPGIDYWEIVTKKSFGIAPGAGIGRKWVNKLGWTFEINVGVGRFITKEQMEDAPGPGVNILSYRPEAIFKGGISIGKRF
jgi:hypothetical protein